MIAGMGFLSSDDHILSHFDFLQKFSFNMLERRLGPLPLIREKDPLKIKGLLGLSRFIVGSRYHGMINGLSRGVPCIGTSWSHKYQALFEDFGCSTFLVSNFSDFHSVDLLIERLLDEKEHSRLRIPLLKCAEGIADKTRRMWALVDKTIKETLVLGR